MKDRNLDNHNDWQTPQYVWEQLDNEFGFDFDPCPLHNDLEKWDGLKEDWKGTSIFVNPPYDRKTKEAFIHKAVEESRKGKFVVMLLPVSTSTKIFHEVILPNAAEIRFVRNRIKFRGVNTKGEYVTENTPMHDSMIVIFMDPNTRYSGLEINSQEFKK
jgi:hypothetical protein